MLDPHHTNWLLGDGLLNPQYNGTSFSVQDVRDSEPLNAAAYQVFLVHYQEGPILFLPPQYSYDKVGFGVHFDTLKECWGAPFTK